MTFGSDLGTFASKTGIRMDKVVRKVLLDFFRDLLVSTPVDTGNARSNWFFGFTRLDSTQPQTSASKNGSPSLKRCLDFAANLHAGGVFYITNNVVYIMRLEYGSSTQAPDGMARVTVARWQNYVNSAVRGAL
jgi:hypothetical protein